MKKECEINYYGMIAEIIGKNTEKLELELNYDESLQSIFVQKYPALQAIPFQVAIDLKIVEKFQGEDFEVISLLPPFAGG